MSIPNKCYQSWPYVVLIVIGTFRFFPSLFEFITKVLMFRLSFRKLFVGGLSWATTDSKFISLILFYFFCLFIYNFSAEELREHFGKYGEIESITVKMDPQTGRSRGFAFLVFKSAENLDKVKIIILLQLKVPC